MTSMLNVHALPRLVSLEHMRGDVVVVIDVLRASTTIIHALAAGATHVIACQEVDQARAEAAAFAPGEVVLGGERGGLRIEGFDLGNSPTDYTPDRVVGRTVVFTTTNGTRAMQQCRQAARVYIGAIVNAAAVVRRLAGSERIHLLCAGTEGHPSEDDLLVAGLLVARLQRGETRYKLNAQAMAVSERWRQTFATLDTLRPERLAEQLRDSRGGRNVVRLGLEADILTAAALDRFDIVPELDPNTMCIQACDASQPRRQ